MSAFSLIDFIRESNRIEGILREPTPGEIEAHENLLTLDLLTVEDVCVFVREVAGTRHRLRDKPGLNVRVGNHVAPAGGPGIKTELADLLEAVNLNQYPRFAWACHVEYETLHPFTDGNGRSGRAIWLWQMGGIDEAPLGFLHHWYYASLENTHPVPRTVQRPTAGERG